MAFMPYLFGKSKQFNPMEQFTPEQRAAVDQYMQLASTGSGGGITLGEMFGGSLGNFQQSDTSSQALQDLIGISGGKGLQQAEDTFSGLASMKFDTDDPSSGFADFQRALQKSTGRSIDTANREAAKSGGFFGSGRQGDIGDIMENQDIQQGQFLSSLFQNTLNQRIAGAQGLQGVAGQRAGLQQSIFQLGDFQRQLDTEKAKSELQEFTRGRNEELSRIGMMENIYQNPLGSFKVKEPGLIGELLGAVGTYIGTRKSGQKDQGTTGGAAGSNYGFGSAEAGYDTSGWR